MTRKTEHETPFKQTWEVSADAYLTYFSGLRQVRFNDNTRPTPMNCIKIQRK